VFVFDVDVQYFGSIYQALNCALLFVTHNAYVSSRSTDMCCYKAALSFFFLSVVRLFLLAEDAGSHKN